MAKQLFINCPHCGEQIDLLTLKNKETENVLKYKQIIEEEVQKEIEVKISEKLSQDFELKMQNEKNQFEIKKQSVISELNNQITKLTSDLNNLSALKESEMKEKESQLFNKFEIEKTNLLNNSSKLEIEIKNLQNSLNNSIELEKSKLISEFSLKQQDLEFKIKDLEMQKNNIENNEISKRKELELELSNKYQEIITIKEKEITDLKIANATNRILNNKTKGENWENEVELELRKLASATGDDIQKITRAGTKADFLQVIRENETDLGKIVFECKNGEWKETWESKLTEDMAKEGGNYAILVATSVAEKFKVPFLVSQKNKNILIADPDSFVFVASIIRKLIVIESNLRAKTDNSEVFEQFNQWKLNSLETFKSIIQKSVDGIEASERTILNKVEDIKKHREKLWRNWQTLMLEFLEGFRY